VGTGLGLGRGFMGAVNGRLGGGTSRSRANLHEAAYFRFFLPRGKPPPSRRSAAVFALRRRRVMRRSCSSKTDAGVRAGGERDAPDVGLSRRRGRQAAEAAAHVPRKGRRRRLDPAPDRLSCCQA